MEVVRTDMYIIVMTVIFLVSAVTIYVVKHIYSKLKLTAIMQLSYDRKFSVTGAFEDDEIFLIETIHNKSFIPIFFVDMEFFLYNQLQTDGYENSSEYITYIKHRDSAMQRVLSRFHLMPYMKVVRQHKIKCGSRGYYKLDAVSVEYNGIPRYITSAAALYIYPKLRDVNYTSKPFNVSQGNVISLSRVITDPFLISGIRDYQPGDPFNLINFKATAKAMATNSIKVNKLDYSSSRIFMIYINFQKLPEINMPGDVYNVIMERALSYSASFINDALHNGYRAGFAANCMMATGEMKIEFPQVSGYYHIEEILKEMAKARLIGGASFASILNSAIINNVRDSEIYIMSMYIDNDIEEKIKLLGRLNNSVNIIKLGDDKSHEI